MVFGTGRRSVGWGLGFGLALVAGAAFAATFSIRTTTATASSDPRISTAVETIYVADDAVIDLTHKRRSVDGAHRSSGTDHSTRVPPWWASASAGFPRLEAGIPDHP